MPEAVSVPVSSVTMQNHLSCNQPKVFPQQHFPWHTPEFKASEELGRLAQEQYYADFKLCQGSKHIICSWCCAMPYKHPTLFKGWLCTVPCSGGRAEPPPSSLVHLFHLCTEPCCFFLPWVGSINEHKTARNLSYSPTSELLHLGWEARSTVGISLSLVVFRSPVFCLFIKKSSHWDGKNKSPDRKKARVALSHPSIYIQLGNRLCSFLHVGYVQASLIFLY